MTFEEVVAASKGFLFGRQTAYRAALDGPMGEVVLRDLAKFCRAHTSTFDADPHIAARLDGRREVWIRIASHLNLSQDELWKLHSEK